MEYVKPQSTSFYLQLPPDNWGAHCHHPPAGIETPFVGLLQFLIRCLKSITVFTFPIQLKKMFTLKHTNQHSPHLAFTYCLTVFKSMTRSISLLSFNSKLNADSFPQQICQHNSLHV